MPIVTISRLLSGPPFMLIYFFDAQETGSIQPIKFKILVLVWFVVALLCYVFQRIDQSHCLTG